MQQPPRREPGKASTRVTKKRHNNGRHSFAFLSLWLAAAFITGFLAMLSAPHSLPTVSGSTLASVAQAEENTQPQPGSKASSANLLTIPPLATKKATTSVAGSQAAAAQASSAATTSGPPPANLQAAVKAALDQYSPAMGKDAEFGLVVQNLDTGDRVVVNNTKNFETASLYKLFVMLTVYYDVSQNKISLDDAITLTPAAAAADEDGGNLIVPVGGSMPVRDLLNAMITNSNNTAALMLLLNAGIPHMQQLAADMGFKTSDLSDSFNFQATPEDIAQYLGRLANQKLLGPQYDPQMLDLMSHDNIRDRIPALLPPGTKVANKTGNLTGIINDAGIVFLPNGQRLVIVAMTHHADNAGATTFISQLSLAAYNFYAKRS